MAKQKINSAQQSNAVQSYTNTGNGGGTGYYVNLGGIKMAWGISGAFSSATNITAAASLPSGFFTTVTGGYCIPAAGNAINAFVPTNTGYNVTDIKCYISGVAGSSTYLTWWVIGV